jgi:tRNA(fMet)-specific endonuclease VapC
VHVLDTNVVSNFLDGNRAHDQLRTRVLSTPPTQLFITVVTLKEVLRGALAAVHRVEKHGGRRLIEQYEELYALHRDLQRFNVLPYDRAADEAFRGIPADIRDRRPDDCRIAAIAIANGFAVVTHNTRHFATVPGLRIEDWELRDVEDMAPPDWAADDSP